MLVVKGSNFVHSEEFFPIFQILIFLFLAEYMKITNFSNVTSICPKYYCTQLSCHVPKEVVEKFSFSELNIKKIKFFTQSPISNFFALTFLMLEVA